MFPGDPRSVSGVREWYAPHLEAWSRSATPLTTLWFWGTERSWAEMSGDLEDSGWEYRGLCVWDKGVAHIAGNCNGATLRKFPVVTEVCAHYTRAAVFSTPVGDADLSMQEWLRTEWKRAGLTLKQADEACGTRNAASRKYLTGDALWYFPPGEMFMRLSTYANEHGAVGGRPYFARDGVVFTNAEEWEQQRAKFNF